MRATLLFLTSLVFITSTAFAGMRTWTSSVGSTLEAELADVLGNTVILKAANGKLITLTLNQLSPADQQVVRQWKDTNAKPKAPAFQSPTSLPAPPKAKLKDGLAKMLPSKILDYKGKKVSQDELAGKTVGFYFSAHWCPPCRQFTPKLVKFRDENKDAFEVVFVSSDNSPKEQMGYMKEAGMKWFTLEHRSREASALAKKFNVRGIPALIIVSPDGETITMNGRGEVLANAKGAAKAWAQAAGS